MVSQPKKNIARKQWTDWRTNARFFARGFFARVYRKVPTAYPAGYFRDRGDMVKVLYYSDGHVPKPWQFYYGSKIIHELFPQNSLHVKAVRWDRGDNAIEIHCDEVPVHSPLAEVQKRSGSWQGNVPDWRDLEANFQFVQAHKKNISRALEKMGQAGILVKMESSLNVSLADPRQPVFFETEIVDPKRTASFIESAPISEASKDRLLRWLARWHALD